MVTVTGWGVDLRYVFVSTCVSFLFLIVCHFCLLLRFPWHSCSTSFWLVIGRVLMPRRLGILELRKTLVFYALLDATPGF